MSENAGEKEQGFTLKLRKWDGLPKEYHLHSIEEVIGKIAQFFPTGAVELEKSDKESVTIRRHWILRFWGFVLITPFIKWNVVIPIEKEPSGKGHCLTVGKDPRYQVHVRIIAK